MLVTLFFWICAVEAFGPWAQYNHFPSYSAQSNGFSDSRYGYNGFSVKRSFALPHSSHISSSNPPSRQYQFGSPHAAAVLSYSQRDNPAQTTYSLKQTGMEGSDPSDEIRSGLAKCFTRYRDCLIVKAAPFERRLGYTPEECAELCVSIGDRQAGGGKYEGRSFVFDKTRGICDLYALTGRQSPASLWTFRNYDYYERTPRCTEDKGEEYRPPPVFPTRDPPISRLVPDSQPLTPSPPVGTFCPRNTLALFQKSDGLELSVQRSEASVHEGVPEDECLSSCQLDTTPRGDATDCLSMDYLRDTQTCVLRSDAASPAGTGTLHENKNAVYYEKLCVQAKYAQECQGGVIERFPQRILVGFNEQTSTVTSFKECLELCLGAQETLGFECRSGMFYYASPNEEDNCLLNTEDHILEPELFVEESLEQVEYFSLTECGLRAGVNLGFKTSFGPNQISVLKGPEANETLPNFLGVQDTKSDSVQDNKVISAGAIKNARSLREKPSFKDDYIRKFPRPRSRTNRFKISRRFEKSGGHSSRLGQELRKFGEKTYRQRLIETNGFV